MHIFIFNPCCTCKQEAGLNLVISGTRWHEQMVFLDVRQGRKIAILFYLLWPSSYWLQFRISWEAILKLQILRNAKVHLTLILTCGWIDVFAWVYCFHSLLSNSRLPHTSSVNEIWRGKKSPYEKLHLFSNANGFAEHYITTKLCFWMTMLPCSWNTWLWHQCCIIRKISAGANSSHCKKKKKKSNWLGQDVIDRVNPFIYCISNDTQ